MQEIAPGIWHWAELHPRIKIPVNSYYLPSERVVIDPIAPRTVSTASRSTGRRPTSFSRTAPLPLERRLRRPLRRDARAVRARGHARVHARRGRRAVRVRRRAPRRDRRARRRRDLPGRAGAVRSAPGKRSRSPTARCAWSRAGRSASSRTRCMDEPEPTKAGLREAYRRARGARLPPPPARARRAVRRTTGARRSPRSPASTRAGIARSRAYSLA